MYYAGVGSRETPEEIGVIMTRVAAALERVGWVLRSGGAIGADTFFEDGVRDVRNKEIFIHKEHVHGRKHDLSQGVINAQRYSDYENAVQIASEVHPKWGMCNLSARQLHARNVYQVLGPGMNPETYSSMVVCWGIPDIHGVPEGGTRTAWNIAVRFGIPRFNLAAKVDRDLILNWLDSRRFND